RVDPAAGAPDAVRDPQPLVAVLAADNGARDRGVVPVAVAVPIAIAQPFAVGLLEPAAHALPGREHAGPVGVFLRRRPPALALGLGQRSRPGRGRLTHARFSPAAMRVSAPGNGYARSAKFLVP